MAPRTTSQNELIREERRTQIMQVALEVIAEQGFSNTSISKIATRAKISKGLLYNYFSHKEDLMMTIMIDGFNQFIDAFNPNKNGVLTNDELHFFIDKTFDILKSNIRFWRMYFMVLLQPEVFKIIEPHIMKTLGPFMQTAYTYFENNGSEDPEVEVRFFAALLDGVGLHFVMDPNNFPLEGVKQKLHQIVR
jgi:AcrR family transcriptional regulator